MMIYSLETKRDPKRDGAGRSGHEDSRTIHTMVFHDHDFQDGHLRPEVMANLAPEERAKLEAALKEAHDAMARAHMGMKLQLLTAEDQEKIHNQVEEAMKQAHQAMQLAQNDGRVLMRCKLGPDGKAQDCVKAIQGPGPVMFRLERRGPDGPPPPPMPPMPGMAPLAPLPPPPAPPAVG